METPTTTKEYTLDAKGQRLGRLASDVAVLLMGKKEKDYAPNKVLDISVKITNASKMDITETKKSDKLYTHYTGFHGGLRQIPMERVIDKKGYGELIRKAVKGMLPKNKLQSRRLALLEIEE